MKTRSILTAWAVFVGFAAHVHAQVVGTVTLAEAPPKSAPIDVSAVPKVGKLHPDGVIPDERIVVGAGGGLANVVVSIRKEAGVELPKPISRTPHTDLEQKACQYVPHVVAVQVGEVLVVKNRDPFLHNVHSQSENRAAVPMGSPQPPADGKDHPLETQAAEYYSVKCDVHPWMRAWVAVIDSPYYGVTDKDGKFALPSGLPDGEYSLVSWHEFYGTRVTRIAVKAGKAEVKLKYDAARPQK